MRFAKQWIQNLFASRTDIAVPDGTRKAFGAVRDSGEGLFQIYADRWLVAATIRTFVLIVFMGGIIFFLNYVVQGTIDTTKDKVYISIYFNRDVEKDLIYSIRDTILADRSDVVSAAVYASREEALAQYRTFSGDDPSIVNALEILGGNPFHDAINVSTYDTRDYEGINTFFVQSYTDLVYGTSFDRSQKAFEDLRSRILFIQRVTLFASFFFIFVAVLVTFGAVRTGVSVHFRQMETVRRIGVAYDDIKQGRRQGLFYALCGSLAVAVTLLALLFGVNPFARSFVIVERETSIISQGAIITFVSLLLFIAAVVCGILFLRRRQNLADQLEKPF